MGSTSRIGSDNAGEWKFRLAILFERNRFCWAFSSPFQLSYAVIQSQNHHSRMRRASVSILAVLMLTLASCTSSKRFVKNPERLSEVQKIAVLPFDSQRPDIGQNIAESMSANLIMSRYTIIERSQLERLLEEQEMTVENIVQGDRSFVGRLSGVDALILGTTVVDRGFAGLVHGGNIDYVSNATARMVDVDTGEVLVAATFTSEGASTMSGVTTATEVGEKLAEKLIEE